MPVTRRSRGRAGRTEKISVSLDRSDLSVLQKRARRLHGGNLSAVIADGVRLVQEQEGREALVFWLGQAAAVTAEPQDTIRAERRRQRIARVYATAVADGRPVTVPAVAIAEWWCGRSDAREIVLRGVRVEATSLSLARLAGEALAAVPGAGAIDALAMTSAALRGDVVYTSDFSDLERLQAYFPAVEVLSV